MEQPQSLWPGRTLERISSPPIPPEEKGIFSWVKSAFSAPLAISRSGTPLQGGERSRAASRDVSTSSPAPSDAVQLHQKASLPSQSSSLPSSLPPPLQRERLWTSPSRSTASSSSSDGRIAPRNNGDHDEEEEEDNDDNDNDVDVDDDDDDEVDSDDELYVPYNPAPDFDLTQSATQKALPADAYSSPATSLGLVRPTARRSVSLHYGPDQVLYGDTPQSTRGVYTRSVSGSSNIVTGTSSPASVMSRPSLVLTPPDSNKAEEIESPLIAGWPVEARKTPSGLPSGHDELDFGPLLSRSYSLEDDLSSEDDRDKLIYAAIVQPQQSKEIASMSGSVAQTHEQQQPDPVFKASAEASRKADWDESRARTPKALADLQGVSAQKAREMAAPVVLPTKQAAEEIAERAGHTPKPSFWNQSSSRQSPQHFKPVPVKPSPAPVAPSPVRRKLFGRRRVESYGNKMSGDDSGTSHEGAMASGRSESTTKGVHPSAVPFWRLGRKISVSQDGPAAAMAVVSSTSAHRHSVAASLSASSSFSIEVPESVASSSLVGDERPASVSLPNDASSIGRYSSRGKTMRVKIRASVGLNGQAAAKKTKSRSKNKNRFDLQFKDLYLAQELNLDSQSAYAIAEISPSSSRLSAFGDHGSVRPPTERREMSTAESQQSIASSTLSHGTVGSFASQTQGPKATWAMKFSLDGRYLATAGQDKVIRVYAVLDTEDKRQSEVAWLKAREEARRPSHMSGTSSHEEGSAPSRRVNASDGQARRSHFLPLPVFSSRPVCEFRGHTSDILSLDWSKGNFLLSSSMDKSVKVWHVDRAQSLVTFVHGDFVCSAVFHKDDRFFLSGSLDGKLRLWNIAAKKVHAVVNVPGMITAVAFSPSGEYAIAGTFSGAILIYRTDDLSYLNSVAVRRSSNKYARGTKITGIEAVPNPVVASGDQADPAPVGEKILITSNDSRIRIYDLTEKRLTAKFKGHTYLNRTSQIRSTIDDRLVVAGSESGEVYVWDWDRDGSGSGSNASSGSQPYECWTAADGARPITVALLAPLKSHGLLAASGDPLETVPGETKQADANAHRTRIAVSVDGQVVRVWRAITPPSDLSLIT